MTNLYCGRSVCVCGGGGGGGGGGHFSSKTCKPQRSMYLLWVLIRNALIRCFL